MDNRGPSAPVMGVSGATEEDEEGKLLIFNVALDRGAELKVISQSHTTEQLASAAIMVMLLDTRPAVCFASSR